MLDDVIAVYVDGPSVFGINGQPNVADGLLKRSTILALNVTVGGDFGRLVERCQARETEIVSIRAEVSQLPAVQRILAVEAQNLPTGIQVWSSGLKGRGQGCGWREGCSGV